MIHDKADLATPSEMVVRGEGIGIALSYGRYRSTHACGRAPATIAQQLADHRENALETQAREAVADDRARLARELHPVISHNLMSQPRSYESVSTWRQPEPQPLSAARTQLVADVAARVDRSGEGRLRVAVDGFTAAGKTSFGHELAAALRALGRTTLRASLDDFKKPWREAHELGYDRVSGDGYYRNAYDFESARELLLAPAGPDGSGVVVLCAHDPLTGEDHRFKAVRAPTDAVLIVDSVFAFRPEYDDLWDFRIWLDIDVDLSLQRGTSRDVQREGLDEATRLHRDRYHAAELIYLAEVDPQGRADLVIDNRQLASPRILRRSGCSPGSIP